MANSKQDEAVNQVLDLIMGQLTANKISGIGTTISAFNAGMERAIYIVTTAKKVWNKN